MPYLIRKIRNQNCYKVYNVKTKRIHSKCSSLEQAQAQKRLLEKIEQKHNNRI